MIVCSRTAAMSAFNHVNVVSTQQIERFHYLLTVYVQIAKHGEPVDGRLVQHLLHNPSEDGGQWQMLVNLVEKYGVVPKACFPDSWSSENSRQMCTITNNKVINHSRDH